MHRPKVSLSLSVVVNGTFEKRETFSKCIRYARMSSQFATQREIWGIGADVFEIG